MYLHGALDFLKDYPLMSFGPSKGNEFILKGYFTFIASAKNGPEIEDSYNIQIFISNNFPYTLPKVIETDNKIPRDLDHHINPDDTLCLGSPLRLLMKISETPHINCFAEQCLVPYLYAVSYKIRNGGDFIFGDLAHGEKGIIDDYTELLELKNRDQVINSLKLLGIKKGLANKRPCPCGCGRRLGSCSFHRKLNSFRKIAPRSFYRNHSRNIGGGS